MLPYSTEELTLAVTAVDRGKRALESLGLACED